MQLSLLSDVNGQRCTKCGQFKDFQHFYVDRRKRDGYMTRCKACMSAAGAQWYAANIAGRTHCDCGGCKACTRKAKVVAWTEANRDKLAEQGRRKRALAATDPAKVARRRRRERLRWRSGGPEEREWVAILRTDPCAYCGGPCEAIDHITPKRHGGDDTWGNLTASCGKCNNSKKASPLLLHLLYAAAERELAA